VIETTSWPHPSFQPLNYSAEEVPAYLNSATKSRLTLSPWHGGGLRLENGLSGAMPTVVRPLQLKPANLRPEA
jgi:hypothetical protein